jgi:hypothetical protein
MVQAWQIQMGRKSYDFEEEEERPRKKSKSSSKKRYSFGEDSEEDDIEAVRVQSDDEEEIVAVDEEDDEEEENDEEWEAKEKDYELKRRLPEMDFILNFAHRRVRDLLDSPDHEDDVNLMRVLATWLGELQNRFETFEKQV